MNVLLSSWTLCFRSHTHVIVCWESYPIGTFVHLVIRWACPSSCFVPYSSFFTDLHFPVSSSASATVFCFSVTVCSSCIQPLGRFASGEPWLLRWRFLKGSWIWYHLPGLCYPACSGIEPSSYFHVILHPSSSFDGPQSYIMNVLLGSRTLCFRSRSHVIACCVSYPVRTCVHLVIHWAWPPSRFVLDP